MSASFLNYNIFIQALMELATMLKNENEELKKSSLFPAQINFSKKADLINYIETQKETIKKNPSFLSKLETEQKEFLKNLAQELQDISYVNHEELIKLKTVNEEIMRLLSMAVANFTPSVEKYNHKGEKEQEKRKVAYSFALNNKV